MQAPKAENPAPSAADSAQALSRLVEQHNRQLVSFLASRLGSEAEARDVAQEAYVRVLQLDQPGAVNFLRAYLYKTAANLATDRLRQRARVERLDPGYRLDELEEHRSPDRQHFAREELALLQQALLELPAAYRRAFLLRRFEERDVEQIGRELRLGASQVRLYLQRTLAYCRLRLDGVAQAEAWIEACR